MASLFLGGFHIALTPPWEGLDEPAHYGTLQQVADTGRMPLARSSRLSLDVEAYQGPLPYAAVPPFPPQRGLSYPDFFQANALPAAEKTVHCRPESPRRYRPGTTSNWQPHWRPLYYRVMSPLYRATRHLSWGSHLLALRMGSFLLAWLALAIGVWSLCPKTPRPTGEGKAISAYPMLFAALWPLLFPSWFPFMARMGMDALAALVMTLVWVLSLQAVRHGLDRRKALALGVLFGLGGLTKAYFLPVAAGWAAFFLLRPFLRKNAIRPAPWGKVALVIGVMAFISGWGYLDNFLRMGVWTGLEELSDLKSSGGFWAGLGHLPAWELIKSQAVFLATLGWSSTRSLVLAPAWSYAPPVALAVALAFFYAASLRKKNPAGEDWLALWLAGPVLLASEIIIVERIMAGSGASALGGYYLHFLATPLGAAAGLGFARFSTHRAARAAMGLMAAYGLFFFLALSLAQALLFAGVLEKAGDKGYSPAMARAPGLAEILKRLDAVAFPGAALIFLALGLAFAGAGLFLAAKSYSSPASSPVPSPDTT